MAAPYVRNWKDVWLVENRHQENRIGADKWPLIGGPNISCPVVFVANPLVRRRDVSPPTGGSHTSSLPLPNIPDTSSSRSSLHRVVVSSRPTESSVKTHPPPPMFLRCCCWAPCLTTVCRPIIRPAGPLARVEAALRAANMVLFPCGAAVSAPCFCSCTYCVWLRGSVRLQSACIPWDRAWSLLKPNARSSSTKIQVLR